LGKLSRLEAPEPANRYERARPGELLHIDVKKLGRIADGPGHRAHGDRSRQRRVVRGGKRSTGWEFVHVCVDDATRLAYAEVLGDEKAQTAIGFLRRALAFCARHGVEVERVMTDNGPAYRSTLHALCCRALTSNTSAHAPTGRAPTAKPSALSAPCSPAGPTAPSMAQAPNAPPPLDGWVWHYNTRRPHGSLSHKPPADPINNLLGSYS
jgi:transposase InsO family protein